jgi:ribosome biogenesis GTPase
VPITARVAIAHGARLTLMLDDGSLQPARPAGRGVDLVCGDLVTCEFDAVHREWRALRALPRNSEVFRSNAQGRDERVAANVTQLIIVIAAVPATDWFLVDRYLSAAACAPASALLLRNKSDLDIDAAAREELDYFARLKIPVVECALQPAISLGDLAAALRGQVSLLVGQSGVGKSSLLRTLLPDSEARIGDLMRGVEGRHTTSATRYYLLPDGGALLDSPGVRAFAPSLTRLEPRALGFSEIAVQAASCRFIDCIHMEEPDCAVRSAVAAGGISTRRYESYRRLRRMHNDARQRAATRGGRR